MTPRPSALLDDLDTAVVALAPIRRRILSALVEPASASGLSERLAMPRQKIGHHLRALEAAGLITLAEERRKRGFVERLFVAAGHYVLDPALMQAPPDPGAVQPTRDQHGQCGVRQSPLEGIGDHEMSAAAWEGLDQHRFRVGNDRARLL